MIDPQFDLWAIDEVHFQQHGSRCRMWVAPEIKDPVLMHEPTRKKIGYFGAVRLCDCKFVYRREEGKFNAESFGDFLKQLRKASCQSGMKVSGFIDNARYHHATMQKDYLEKCSERFNLIFLPPYSPDLNPIERVLKMTRRFCAHNKYFPSLESLISSIEALFDDWREEVTI